jgi:hypothetical protein
MPNSADGRRADGVNLVGGPLTAWNRCEPIDNRSPALAQADADVNNDNFLITMAAERECDPRGRWPGANDQRDRHGDRTGSTCTITVLDADEREQIVGSDDTSIEMDGTPLRDV